MRTTLTVWILALLLAPAAESAAEDPTAPIKKVGREGEGDAGAAAAWRVLAARGPEALPDLLRAMDDADPVASNWLRPAVDAVGEKALRVGAPLPARDLEAFVADLKHTPAARRLAYEWGFGMSRWW